MSRGPLWMLTAMARESAVPETIPEQSGIPGSFAERAVDNLPEQIQNNQIRIFVALHY